MKKTILGVILSALFLSTAVTAQASEESKTQNSHKVNASKEALKRIDKSINQTTKQLTVLDKQIDNHYEKSKTEGLKFSTEDRVKFLDNFFEKLEKEDSNIEDIYFISDYLPVKMAEKNIDNDTKKQRISQKFLAAVFQLMANDINADVHFKVAGDRNETLMISSDQPVKITMEDFTEDLKATMLHIGFENVLFTDFKEDFRLEPLISSLIEDEITINKTGLDIQ